MPGVVMGQPVSPSGRTGVPHVCTVLWVTAIILVIVGIVQLFQGQIIVAIVLFVAAVLVGPGGYSLFRARIANVGSHWLAGQSVGANLGVEGGAGAEHLGWLLAVALCCRSHRGTLIAQTHSFSGAAGDDEAPTGSVEGRRSQLVGSRTCRFGRVFRRPAGEPRPAPTVPFPCRWRSGSRATDTRCSHRRPSRR